MGLSCSCRGFCSSFVIFSTSVRMGSGNGGGASGVAWARLAERLFRRLLNMLPLLLAPDLDDAPSPSSLGPFLSDELKASLNRRRPGETLRRFPLGSAGTPRFILDCVPGLGGSTLFESEVSAALGALTADPNSAFSCSSSGESAVVVLMSGEEDV